MDENKEQLPNRRAGKIILIVLACVLALAVGGYCALCAWINGTERVLPNTSAIGVELGGMTRAQAENAIWEAAQNRRAGQTLEVTVPNVAGEMETVATLDGETTIPVDAAATAADALRRGREQGFLFLGWNWLQAYWTQPVTVDVLYSDAGYAEMTRQLEQFIRQFNQENAMVEPGWEVRTEEETGLPSAIDFALGRDGLALTLDRVREQIIPALRSDAFNTLTLQPEVIPASEPDLEGLYRQLYVAPADAVLDPETVEIIPHVTGISFDIAQVRTQLEAAGGGTVTVELTRTEPEVTTQGLEAILFRDVLGSCTTTVGGTANRATNVRIAAEMCNNWILMPGEQFSYNAATGSRTPEKGFLPAPSYMAGNTVDTVGGGICQVSSTLYLASLRANLEIVERRNHSFAVGYVPDGMDATVYYDAIEFIIANNTEHPIKLVMKMENRTLSVSILGTNVDGSYVKVTNRYLSTNPYETIYEADPTLQPGESRVKVDGYTGKVVEVYRNVYDKDGNLISSTLESKDYYKRRDKVVLLAPQDMPGAEPEPAPSPEPTPEPPPSPEPEVTPEPENTPDPETAPAA